jgi:hypothetical protein
MSRTDHHQPAWIRTQDTATSWERHWCIDGDTCAEVLTRRGLCHRWDRHHSTIWVPALNKREIATGCHQPERAHVRDTLRAAVRDYNTNGHTDIEVERRQRRRTMWNGGAWG